MGDVCVLGFPNYTAVLSLGPSETRSYRMATEKQGKGSASCQLLLVLSRHLSPGQGGSGDEQGDPTLPSSLRDAMPRLSSSLFIRARCSWQTQRPSFHLDFSVSSKG